MVVDDPGIVVAHGGEQAEQVGGGAVALVPRGPADQLGQPAERVLHVAVEHVQVGHHRLGVHVVRGVGCSGAACCRSTPWVRSSTFAIASPAEASASAGFASTSSGLCHRPLDVALAERVLGRGVPGVDLGLLTLGRDGGAVGSRLVPGGDPLGGDLLHHLGERGAQLVDGQRVLEQRHRPAVEDQHDQRDRRDLHRLSDSRCRVDVDETGQEAALELVRQGAYVVGEGAALRHPGAGVEHQQDRRGHRLLENLLEVLLAEVHGVRRTARATGGRGAGRGTTGRAAGPPAGGAGRRRADRSIAPGRENGCWLMGTSSPMAGRGARTVTESPLERGRGRMAALKGGEFELSEPTVRFRGSACPGHRRNPRPRPHAGRCLPPRRRPGHRHRHPVAHQRL